MHPLLSFLEQLEANNTTERMHAHQSEYKAAKTALLALAQRYIDSISNFDATIWELYPAETIFRLAKDTRFSKDKSPYKTNFGIVIAPGGKKSIFPCYYIHLQPGNRSFLACGLYHPEPRIQKAVRDRLVTHRNDLSQSITDQVFSETRGSIEGDAYKKTPPGYPKDHPAAPLIQHKDWLIHLPLSDNDITDTAYFDRSVHAFKIAFGFNQRLYNAIAYALKNNN